MSNVHSTLIGSELHFSKMFQSPNPPSAAPTYVGQTYFDNTNGVLYVAVNASSVSDWKAVTGVGGPNAVVDVATATYTVATSYNSSLFNLTYVDARTITLPASPLNGFEVSFFDGAGTADAKNITINTSGGNNFYYSGSSFVIKSRYACFVFTYDSATSSWIPKCSYAGLDLQAITVNGLTGAGLTVQTPDTNPVTLKVNLTNSLNLAATSITGYISGTQKFLLNTTDCIISKTLTLQDTTTVSKQLQVSLSGATASTTTILAAVQTTNRTLTLPDATDTLVGKATTDTLTNKSFNSATTMLAANQLRFNNAANTFYTSIIGGNNSSNLGLTLPITAPLAGQAITSSDTNGTLAWATVDTVSQQSVASAANINALASSTASVYITGATTTNLNGITAGVAGQTLTVTNASAAYITVVNNSGSASAADRVSTPNSINLVIPPKFSIIFNYSGSDWAVSSQVSARNIIGAINGVAPIAGIIGENLYNAGTSLAIPEIPTWSAPFTLDLTKGVWDISIEGAGTISMVTADITVWIGFSNTSGTTFPDASLPASAVREIIDCGLSDQSFTLSITKRRITLSADTTYYYKTGYSSSSGLPGSISLDYAVMSATRVG